MIMRIVITITVVCLAISSLSTATAEAEASLQQSAEVPETNVQQQNVVPDDEGIKINVSAIAARFIKDYVTPTLCSYSPGFCAKHQLESRDIKSYLATAGTLFAGVLGVMLTKITVLIVLSVLSTVIGKMLLLYALFKTGHTVPHHDHHSYKSAHHNAQPFVKYTKDKYYIKHSPSIHSHDVVVDSPPEYEASPYHAHSPYALESTVHDHKLKGVSYYKR